MLDLEMLKRDREKALEDKAELFDFYHDHWDELVLELEVEWLKSRLKTYKSQDAEGQAVERRPPIHAEGPECKGGQNPPNTSTLRPAAPKGSGVRT